MYSVSNVTFQDSYISQNPKDDSSGVKDNSNVSAQDIKKYYDELGEYTKPSMDNICSIWNQGFKSEGNGFYNKHSEFCDIYGNAAAKFGQALQSNQNLKSALMAVKNATNEAVLGLKGLINQENAFMSKNIISADKKQNMQEQNMTNSADTNMANNQKSNENDTFWNLAMGLINNLFGKPHSNSQIT